MWFFYVNILLLDTICHSDTPIVIQSEAKNLENILVNLFLYVTKTFRYAQQQVVILSIAKDLYTSTSAQRDSSLRSE